MKSTHTFSLSEVVKLLTVGIANNSELNHINGFVEFEFSNNDLDKFLTVKTL